MNALYECIYAVRPARYGSIMVMVEYLYSAFKFNKCQSTRHYYNQKYPILNNRQYNQ